MTRPPRRRQDHHAFTELVGPHLPALHNIAKGLTRDPHRAEDLLQETCLRAFSGLDAMRGTDAKAWLVAIMMNCLRMDLRRSQRRAQEDLGSETELASLAPSVEHDALVAIDRRRIAAALRLLPEPARTTIVLCDIGGLTAQQAADVLGCPRGTVLARVHRARRQLAQLVDQGVRS